MTPKLSIRSFTNDQFILDKVFYTNFYRMKGFPEGTQKPIVLDLGAHCGYFSFTAMSLGAKKVYAFEPFVANYKMLLENTLDNPIAQVIPYQLGVYVAPVCLTFNYPVLLNKSYFDYSNIGLDVNVDNPEYCKCCMLTLDTILEQYVGEAVDLMKLSIGYGELQILASSNLISSRVNHICGEISLDEGGKANLSHIFMSKGFSDFQFYPVANEEDKKLLFHASKTKREEMFN